MSESAVVRREDPPHMGLQKAGAVVAFRRHQEEIEAAPGVWFHLWQGDFRARPERNARDGHNPANYEGLILQAALRTDPAYPYKAKVRSKHLDDNLWHLWIKLVPKENFDGGADD